MFLFCVYNLLPLICNFLSVRDVKNLALVHSTFREILKREDLLRIVFKNFPMCLLDAGRNMFILYKSVPVYADVEFRTAFSKKTLRWVRMARLFDQALQARSDAPSVHTEERVDLLCPKNSQLGSKHCCVPSQKGEDAQLCNGVPRSLLEHLYSCFWF